MVVCHEAVGAAVLAHGGDEDAVGEGDVADCEGAEDGVGGGGICSTVGDGFACWLGLFWREVGDVGFGGGAEVGVCTC